MDEVAADLFESDVLRAVEGDYALLCSRIRDACDAVQRAADRSGKDILFYCKRGRHRSAAMLACLILWSTSRLSVWEVLTMIKRARGSVQFFETRSPGGYEPLRPVIEAFAASQMLQRRCS